jgi:tetratricopeptide (TPR) repeat protein
MRRFGAFAASVALLGCVGQLLVFSQALIPSPEFGLLMVQGPLSRFGLQAVIGGLGVVGGFGWSVARLAGHLPARTFRLCAIGGVVGLLSLLQVTALNERASSQFIVYAYDLWWPLLPAWIMLSLIDCCFIIVGIETLAVRRWAGAFFLTGLSLWALTQRPFYEATSEYGWFICLGIAFASNQYLAVACTRKELEHVNPWIRRLLLGVLVLIGLGFAGVFVLLEFGTDTQLPNALLIAWVSLGLVLAVVRQVYVAKKTNQSLWGELGEGVWRKATLLCLILIVAASLSALVYRVPALEPNMALTFFFVSLAGITEIITDGILKRVYDIIRNDNFFTAESPLLKAWAWVRVWIARVFRASVNSLRRVFSADSVLKLVAKAIVGIILLIALNELPNAGKTIIQPLKVHGDIHESGEAAANRLLTNILIMSQELQPDIMIPTPGQKAKSVKLSSFKTGAPDVELGKGTDFSIGGVSIPLQLLLVPIQTPVRAMLGTRVIAGNVQNEGVRYTLDAGSSDGQSWVVTVPNAGQRHGKDSNTVSPLDTLTEKLAFEIFRSSPGIASVGMTTSWEAFGWFRNGMRSMARYERGDIDALSDAIREFRQSVAADPGFSLANYRLGLALQSDGQPTAAAEALRESISNNPDFLAGFVALGFHLFSIDSYFGGGPAVAQPLTARGTRNAIKDTSECSRLWRNVITRGRDESTLPDRASAYFGLSGLARKAGQFAVSFYYAQRALSIYATIRQPLRSDPQIRRAQASVLNDIGVGLQWYHATDTIDDDTTWHCTAETVLPEHVRSDGVIFLRDLYHGPLLSAALDYYRQAHSLNHYDPVIRCNVAEASYALGDPKQMAILARDAGIHNYAARTYADLAKNLSFGEYGWTHTYFRLALAEYEAALKLEPTNVSALNGYAYAVWEWRLLMPRKRPPDGASAREVHRAEGYARNAVKLSVNKSLVDQVTYRSTLGEVLLAQGRAWEAKEELEKAEQSAPKHREFDEIRWDLAQALLAFASKHNPLCNAKCNCDSAFKKAIVLLESIRSNEQDQELQPFNSDASYLDPIWVRSVTSRDPPFGVEEAPDPGIVHYVLRNSNGHEAPTYEKCDIPDWLGVYCEMDDTLFLHVWGRGVDRRIQVGYGIRNDVYLSSTPANTHDAYFAQLESLDSKSVSEVYSLFTYNDRMKNLIKLAFTRE